MSECVRSLTRPSMCGGGSCRANALTHPVDILELQFFGGGDLRYLEDRSHKRLPDDGQCVLVEGIHEGPGGPRRTVEAMDWPGHTRWSVSSTRTRPFTQLVLDPTGRTLVVSIDNQDDSAVQIDVETGRVVQRLPLSPMCVGPHVQVAVAAAAAESFGTPRGYAMYNTADKRWLVNLGVETTPGLPPVFSRRGYYLAWPDDRGGVSLWTGQCADDPRSRSLNCW